MNVVTVLNFLNVKFVNVVVCFNKSLMFVPVTMHNCLSFPTKKTTLYKCNLTCHFVIKPDDHDLTMAEQSVYKIVTSTTSSIEYLYLKNPLTSKDNKHK